VVPAAQRAGMAIIPYFPLASGLLTGKYRRGMPAPPGTRMDSWKHLAGSLFTEQNFDRVERLQGFARERDHTLGELAIAWLLAHSYVPSVIAGATQASQVQANVQAAAWRLSEQELAEIDRLAPATPG